MVEYKIIETYKQEEVSSLHLNKDIADKMSDEDKTTCINKWLNAISFCGCVYQNGTFICPEHHVVNTIDNGCCIIYTAIIESKTFDISIRRERGVNRKRSNLRQ